MDRGFAWYGLANSVPKHGYHSASEYLLYGMACRHLPSIERMGCVVACQWGGRAGEGEVPAYADVPPPRCPRLLVGLDRPRHNWVFFGSTHKVGQALVDVGITGFSLGAHTRLVRPCLLSGLLLEGPLQPWEHAFERPQGSLLFPSDSGDQAESLGGERPLQFSWRSYSGLGPCVLLAF